MLDIIIGFFLCSLGVTLTLTSVLVITMLIDRYKEGRDEKE